MTSEETITEEKISVVSEELHHYKCERCGFEYDKSHDYMPFLCYRCIRYIAKKTWTMIHTIQPSTSTPEISEV